MVSSSENYHAGSGGFDASTMDSTLYNGTQRTRHDSNALLMLPAPLAGLGKPTSSSTGASRSSEDAYMSDVGSSSHQRLIPSPTSPDQYTESLEAPAPRYPVGNTSFESQISRGAGNNVPVLRNPTLSSNYPGETTNPFHNSEPFTVGYETAATFETHEEYPALPPTTTNRQQSRGVSLSDYGPVPGPEGVRRVSRPVTKSARPTSQTPPNQNRYSRASTYVLPPGAAPPQPSGYGGYN